MRRFLREGRLLAVLLLFAVPAFASDPLDQIPEAAHWSDLAAVDPVAAAEDFDPLLDAQFDENLDFGQSGSASDPFEKTNRVVLGFNQGLNRWVLTPITRGYRFVVPEPARQGVRRALTNLNAPSTLVNDLLQLRFRDAGETLGRFLLNSTLGIGGVFDVGVEAGWEHHSSDFGQTLARVGVGSGPYLVLPLFGPNTLRDGVGDLVDIMFQPLTYLIGPTPNLMIGTGRGFAELEANSTALEALEESSVDYYAALRSAYTQNRRAEVEPPEAFASEP